MDRREHEHEHSAVQIDLPYSMHADMRKYRACAAAPIDFNADEHAAHAPLGTLPGTVPTTSCTHTSVYIYIYIYACVLSMRH